MNTIECGLHKDRDEILLFVSKHKNIYIYGKGTVGTYTMNYLKSESISVNGFVVTTSEGEKIYDGVPVFSLNEVTFDPNDGIIIAVREGLQSELYSILLGRGVTADQIYGQKMICTNEGALINFSCKLKDYRDDNGNYFEEFKDLDKLGIDAGTDKSSKWHNYLSKYEFFLNKYKDEKINVLELGVLDGNSLRMWKKYFSNADIYGVDIDSKCKENEEERIKIIIGDLDDGSFLQSISGIKPSIVIEDASHSWNQQILALYSLFTSMPSGGIYIVEDIETSFSVWKHRGYDNAIISGYEMCEAIAKVVTSGELLNPREESAAIMNLKAEIYDIAKKTAMISFIHGSCIMIRN